MNGQLTSDHHPTGFINEDMRMEEEDTIFSYYEGFMDENYYKQGFGRIVLSDGDQKIGFWKDDIENGNFFEMEYDNIRDLDINQVPLDMWKRVLY